MKPPLVVLGWFLLIVGFWGGVGVSVSYAVAGDWILSGGSLGSAALSFVLGSQFLKYGFCR